MFVADQQGIVYSIGLATGIKTVFLDITACTLTTGGYNEKGLLGLAFHPDYQNNGLFYTDNIANSAGCVGGGTVYRCMPVGFVDFGVRPQDYFAI